MHKRFESERDVRLQRGDGGKVTESSEGEHVHTAHQLVAMCARDSNRKEMSDSSGVMEEVSQKGHGYIPPVEERQRSMQNHGRSALQRGDGEKVTESSEAGTYRSLWGKQRKRAGNEGQYFNGVMEESSWKGRGWPDAHSGGRESMQKHERVSSSTG